MTLPTVEVAPQDFSSRYRVPYPDLYDSFERNFQVNSNYEISFTMTYSDAFKAAYDLLQSKGFVAYQGRWYSIQQIELGQDEQGNSTKKVTATNYVIDMMKNIRLDPEQPIESKPEISGGDSGDSSDSGEPQPGTVIKKTDELQVFTLDSCLHKFIDGNDQGLGFKLHGSFPSVNVECTGSLFEWLNSNLSLFGAYLAPGQNNLKQIDIYDLQSYTINTGRQFRYLNNLTSSDIQTDVTDMVNDFEVFGGKMEKDTTVANGGGSAGNGIDEPQGGDWTPVMQNAAGLVGEKLSDGDIANIKNRIRIESSGSETIVNNWDSNAAAGHPSKGLLQFIDSTFNYYCRPPYTNILKGLDQLIAMMNIPNWRSQISGSGGWSPHGAPISKEAIQPKPVVSDSIWGWPFPSTGEGSFLGGQLFGKNPGGEFRPNGFHDGLDFGSIDHPGSEIHAIHGGKVTVGPAWGNGGIGWYVVITDSTGLNVEYQEAFSNAANIHVHVGDTVHTGDVIGIRDRDHVHIGITRHSFPEAFSHAFSNDGTWLNPLDTIKNGAGSGAGSSGGDSGGTTTTSASYYNLHYHFEDQDSIKKYGRHRGPQVVVDSIYDMDALKKYVSASVPHEPPTTLTINGVTEQVGLGQQMRLVIPEQGINFDVLLLGIQGNDPDIRPGAEQSLTFNNTGLTMKNVNNAIYKAIRGVKAGPQSFMLGGVAVSRPEDHFGNSDSDANHSQGPQKTFTEADLEAIKKFTDS